MNVPKNEDMLQQSPLQQLPLQQLPYVRHELFGRPLGTQWVLRDCLTRAQKTSMKERKMERLWHLAVVDTTFRDNIVCHDRMLRPACRQAFIDQRRRAAHSFARPVIEWFADRCLICFETIKLTRRIPSRSEPGLQTPLRCQRWCHRREELSVLRP